VWWNSRSRFKHCAVHTAIRSPKFNQKGTIVLRAVDRDPVLMVGTERTLIQNGRRRRLSAWRPSTGNPLAHAIS
jgi:hypothetical protein